LPSGKPGAVQVVRTEGLPGTAAPDTITNLDPGAAGVFAIGGGASVFDAVVNDDPISSGSDVAYPFDPTSISDELPGTMSSVDPAAPKRSKPQVKKQFAKLARPTNLKELK